MILRNICFLCAILWTASNAATVQYKSLLDFQSQSRVFRGFGGDIDCRTLTRLPTKVESVNFYSDRRSSVIDPLLYKRFLELRKVVADEEDFLARTNTKFVSAPVISRTAIADCLRTHLLKFATDDAFVASDDIRGGGAVRLMSVTPLMSYLLLRDGSRITEADDNEIRAWIQRLMSRLLWLEAKYKYDNNIEDWTAAAFALGAVALNQPELLEHALSVVRKKAGAITADGVLPQEVARGAMGVEYSLSATQALALVIAVAQANGTNILAQPEGAPILRMMQRMVKTINDPQSFLALTDEPGAIAPEHFDRQVMGWLEIYYRQTRDPEALRAICARRPLYSWRTGGDWFVFFGHPDQCQSK